MNTFGSLDALGGVIKKYRKKAGFTQTGLAEKLDVTRNTIIAWETGRVRPPLEMLMKVTRLLAIPVTELFDADGVSAELSDSEERFLSLYRQLRPENRRTVSEILQVLLDEEHTQKITELTRCYRPLLTLETPAAAGPGCDYLDNTEATVHFYRTNSRYARADLVCRVCGHSMEPFYRDGDYVYAIHSKSAEDGADVICDSNDGRLLKRKSGNRLISLNPDPRYTVRKYADDDVHIVAVVLGVVPEGDRTDASLEPELETVHAKEVRKIKRQLRLEE